jgi:hypothetical protein
MLNYQYNCTSPKNIDELFFIVENSREITYKTFISKVDKEFIKEFNESMYIPINKDWTVSFWKSKTPEGKPVYYFKHSAIEYIFY